MQRVLPGAGERGGGGSAGGAGLLAPGLQVPTLTQGQPEISLEPLLVLGPPDWSAETQPGGSAGARRPSCGAGLMFTRRLKTPSENG